MLKNNDQYRADPAAHISLRDVNVEFTIYGVHARSLKNHALRLTTGGLISFPSDSRVVVNGLTEISLDIKEGERVGLVGHNGAGKTTLLRVLAGAYEPVRGTFRRVGRTSSLFDMSYGFDGDASGMENILIRGMYLGLDREMLLKRQQEIADFSGLGGYIYMPAHTYSVGMLMRLAFSISTCVSPQILLMDEWLAVGDATFVGKAEQRLIDLIGTVGILVIATHSFSILDRVCNRLVWLEAGKIVADGPIEKVKPAFLASLKQLEGKASHEVVGVDGSASS
jgi:ABC-type polysaccharide/polyol phosphate transport system ATPase subunit